MATVHAPQITKLKDAIIRIGREHGDDERFSGDIGDAAHRTHPSYHISYEDVKSKFGLGVYSLSLRWDRLVRPQNRNMVCAIDFSSKQIHDLVVVIQRLHRMAVTNPAQLKKMRVNEFAGPDGHGGVFAMSLGADGKYHRTFGWDASHEKHVHIDFMRRHIDSKRIPLVAQFWRGL